MDPKNSSELVYLLAGALYTAQSKKRVLCVILDSNFEFIRFQCCQ